MVGPTRAKPPSADSAIGVPTTTPVAFALDGKPFLERMTVLAEDGCGILAPVEPPVGSKLDIVFRLSTADVPIRCRGEVLGHAPTTPAGLKHAAPGAAVPASAMGAIDGDSATAIFRVSDLKGAPKAPQKGAANASAKPKAGGASRPKGFCLRFVDLDAAGKDAVRQHLAAARDLEGKLGREDVAERPDIAQTFTEGDLAKRALDW